MKPIQFTATMALVILATISVVFAAKEPNDTTGQGTQNMTYGQCVSTAANVKNTCFETTKTASDTCKNNTADKTAAKACNNDYKKAKAQCKTDFKSTKKTCAQQYKPGFFEKMRYALK